MYICEKLFSKTQSINLVLVLQAHSFWNGAYRVLLFIFYFKITRYVCEMETLMSNTNLNISLYS